MTYLAKSNKFKISCFSLKLQDSNNYQLISSATYENISLISDNTYNTIIDNFNINLTISNNIVTLPSGKYYLDARLEIGNGNSNWVSTYRWFEWDGSSKTTLGHHAGEIGRKPEQSGYDIFGEHAKAYIESDGSKQIGLECKDVTGSARIYPEKSRITIWKLE